MTSGSPLPTWKYVLQLARYKWPIYLASGLLASVLFYLFPLLPGLVLRQLFDTLAAGPQAAASAVQTIRILVLLLVAIAVARVSVILLASLAENTLHFFVNTLLQRNMMAHVLGRPGAQALPYSAGEALSRFRDDVYAVSGFLSWTIDPVGQAVALTVGVIVLAQINLWITLAIFVPLAVVIIVLNQATQRIQKYRRATQQSIGNVTGLLGELFGAITSIKVASAENDVVRHLETLNEDRRRATLHDTLFNEFISTVSYNMGNLGTGVLLVSGAAALSSGDFSIGDFALFVSYIEWLTVITGMFGNFLARYRQVTVSLERMLVLMAGAPADTLVRGHPTYLLGSLPDLDREPARQGAFRSLSVRDLCFSYPDTQRGIQDISFELKPGTLTVVTGPIGSGKTTLLRCLLGLLPAAGQIAWDGSPVLDPASFFVPPRTAYTPQVPRLFSESLRDNILMGLVDDTASGGKDFRLQAAVYAAVMEADLAGLEEGLDTLVGPRGTKLSGGQRQRAAAARMFVRQPAILVFDDLSSALDVETEAVLWDRLLSIPDPPAVLAVSHRKRVLRRADQILVLAEGRLQARRAFEALSAAFPELGS